MNRPHPVLVAAWSLVWFTLSAESVRAEPQSPDTKDWIEAKAGELSLTLHRRTNGVRIVGLRDLALNQQLLATNALPLFNLTLRHAHSTQEVQLTAEAGWNHMSLRQKRNTLELQWTQPTNETIAGLSVVADALLFR